jgi:hypothetical protein
MPDAQEARNAGDYLTDVDFTEDDVREHIEHAREFIALAERMLGSITN